MLPIDDVDRLVSVRTLYAITPDVSKIQPFQRGENIYPNRFVTELNDVSGLREVFNGKFQRTEPEFIQYVEYLCCILAAGLDENIDIFGITRPGMKSQRLGADDAIAHIMLV